MVEAYINKILTQIMPNGQIKQVRIQGFEYDIPFKNSIKIFEKIEIDKTIYKRVVVPSNTKTDQGYSNYYGISRRHRGETYFHTNNPLKGGCAGKQK